MVRARQGCVWFTCLKVSFSDARQFFHLQFVFSAVHGSSCCFLSIYVGSSHAGVFLVGFSSWLVSSPSQPSVATELPSTCEDGEGDYIEVLSCDVFLQYIVFGPCSHLVQRWRSVAWSPSIPCQRVRDWNCGIRDRTKLLGSLGYRRDVLEGSSFDPEDW